MIVKFPALPCGASAAKPRETAPKISSGETKRRLKVQNSARVSQRQIDEKSCMLLLYGTIIQDKHCLLEPQLAPVVTEKRRVFPFRNTRL
jgi:hypothetical protein